MPILLFNTFYHFVGAVSLPTQYKKLISFATEVMRGWNCVWRIKLKSVYDKYDISDGLTILVDRLWPRGVRKSTPNVEIWMSDIAPSDKLRKWYNHDSKRWASFKQKYLKELKTNDLSDELISLVVNSNVTTFVYASSNHECNNAVVLKTYIEGLIKKCK